MLVAAAAAVYTPVREGGRKGGSEPARGREKTEQVREPSSSVGAEWGAVWIKLPQKKGLQQDVKEGWGMKCGPPAGAEWQDRHWQPSQASEKSHGASQRLHQRHLSELTHRLDFATV